MELALVSNVSTDADEEGATTVGWYGCTFLTKGFPKSKTAT